MTPAIASTAGASASHRRSGGGPASRRSTRNAGTRVSCSSDGSAKPASMARATSEPDQHRPPAGRRQIGAQQSGSTRSSQQLRQPAGRRAEHAGHDRQQQQLPQVHAEHEAARARPASSSARPHPGGAPRSCARSSPSPPRTAAPPPGSPAPGNGPRAARPRRSADWRRPHVGQALARRACARDQRRKRPERRARRRRAAARTACGSPAAPVASRPGRHR